MLGQELDRKFVESERPTLVKGGAQWFFTVRITEFGTRTALQ